MIRPRVPCDTGTIRTLIADGNTRRRMVLGWLLARDDRFEVVASVGWGQAALERPERLDAVLLDIALPDLDVFDTVRALRRPRPHPIIVVTGVDVPYLRAAALDAGAHGYVDLSAGATGLGDLVAGLHARRPLD